VGAQKIMKWKRLEKQYTTLEFPTIANSSRTFCNYLRGWIISTNL